LGIDAPLFLLLALGTLVVGALFLFLFALTFGVGVAVLGDDALR